MTREDQPVPLASMSGLLHVPWRDFARAASRDESSVVRAAFSFRLALSSEMPLKCVNNLDWAKTRPNPSARKAHTFQRFPPLNENSRRCSGAKPRSLAQAVDHKKCRTIRCNIGIETANRIIQTKATIHLPEPELDRMKAGMPKPVPTIQAKERSPSA